MPATDALPLSGAGAASGAGVVRAVADAPADVACTHCGAPVPAALVEAGAGRQFCCAGCSTAYAVLHEHGLDGYYALPERRDAPVRPSGRTFEEFDHDAFRELYVRRTADGLAAVELYLEGVHCASCVWLVERVPLMLPGVMRAELQVRRSLARVEWDDAAIPLSEVARALDRLGYRPHPFRGVRAEEMRRREDRAMLARVGVAGAIAGNVMLVAVAMYSGWFGGMEAEYERFFRWIGLLLTAVSLAWPGRTFFTSAIGALRARSLHMDVPIALALAVGFARGAINTVRDAGPIYVETLATLVFALLAGRYLQQRGQRAAADSAELLHSLAPSAARVVEEGEVRELPVEALLPGMVLDVRAGDTLAADGVVLSGHSTLDSSLLTGESRPAGVRAGDEVFAGTVNLAAPLRVRVTGAGERSRLAAILRGVEESVQRRAPVVKLADRLSGWFVGIVLLLAVVTLVVRSASGAGDAVDDAIALLIVTCPCALALATPLAVSVSVGRAARSGILVKGGDVVEQLARPGLLLLDKTGTVTQARTALEAWTGPGWVRPLVLGLEAGSPHPLAEGFRRAWPGVMPATVEGATHTVGGGIEGVAGGRWVVIGSPRFVRDRVAQAVGQGGQGEGADDVALPTDVPLTPVLVAVDGRIVAAAGFGDPLRDDAAASVARLRERGWRVGLLSGDDPAVLDAVGRRLGLSPADCTGGASPEEKRRVVEEAARRGERVVMVGDGVNDAAAIAAASVGIGVHGGAEASLATADVYLTTPGLAPLVRLVEGAGRTMTVIRRNIAFSLAYNVVGVALAMTGQIDPLVATVLMPISSLTVVLASWRSRTFAAADPFVPAAAAGEGR